jgi:hypothetical protein
VGGVGDFVVGLLKKKGGGLGEVGQRVERVQLPDCRMANHGHHGDEPTTSQLLNSNKEKGRVIYQLFSYV